MAALRSRCGHYIFALWFLLSFLSSPNLSGRRLDVYHTSTHGVALVRIQNAGLKCAARGSLEMQDPKNRQKGHLGSITQLCRAISSQLRHISTIGKKLLSNNMSPIRPYNMVNFGPLAAEIVSLVWGISANFNGFRVLAALLHRCTALWQWALAKLCGVQHRAPPIFGRVAITLGTGPHSSKY